MPGIGRAFYENGAIGWKESDVVELFECESMTSGGCGIGPRLSLHQPITIDLM